MAERLLNISRNRRVRVLVVCGISLMAAVFIYFPNYAKLRKLKEQNRVLILENKRLEEEIADYEEKARGLGKDPYLYEKIAREDLGVAREDEIVIDIVR